MAGHQLLHLLAKIRRNWEPLIFLVTFCLLDYSLKAILLSEKAYSGYRPLEILFAAAHFHVKYLEPLLWPALLVMILTALWLRWAGRPSRLMLDLIGCWFSFRMVTQFLVVNLLMFVPARKPELLIIQIVLFFPEVILSWGWIYWRLDSFSRKQGKPLVLLGDNPGCPAVFDYFAASMNATLTNQNALVRGATPWMQILVFAHGLMMLDLMGLTLSRAISLAGALMMPPAG